MNIFFRNFTQSLKFVLEAPDMSVAVIQCVGRICAFIASQANSKSSVQLLLPLRADRSTVQHLTCFAGNGRCVWLCGPLSFGHEAFDIQLVLDWQLSVRTFVGISLVGLCCSSPVRNRVSQYASAPFFTLSGTRRRTTSWVRKCESHLQTVLA